MCILLWKLLPEGLCGILSFWSWACSSSQTATEKDLLSLSTSSGGRCLVREQDQPCIRVGTVCVCVSVFGKGEILIFPSSVPAEHFVGIRLYLFMFLACLSTVSDTQVDLE